MKKYIQTTTINPAIVKLAVVDLINGYLDDYYNVIDETEDSWEVEAEKGEDLKPFVDRLYRYMDSYIECGPVEELDSDYEFTVKGCATICVSYRKYYKFDSFIVGVY